MLQEEIGTSATNEEFKTIVLKDGSFCKVDKDFKDNGKPWYRTTYGYAVNHKLGLMHRYIMNPPDDMVVDHINGDRLDNRRSNLRVITKGDNCKSTSRKKGSKSKYKGVSPCSSNTKWRATLTLDRKQKHLGYFETEEEAGMAYDLGALKYHKEFAKLNFKDKLEEYLKEIEKDETK